MDVKGSLTFSGCFSLEDIAVKKDEDNVDLEVILLVMQGFVAQRPETRTREDFASVVVFLPSTN